MLLQATTGSETFPGAMVKVHITARRASGAEMPLYMGRKDPNSGIAEVGAPERIPASHRNTNHGEWYVGRYQLRDGQLLHVAVSRRPGSSIFGYDNHDLFLRMRQGAALRRMRIPLTGKPEANLTAAYVEGNFDYVPIDWFDALNIDVSRNIEKFEDGPMFDWLEDEILEKETASWKPPELRALTTVKGNTVLVPTPKAHRRPILRK